MRRLFGTGEPSVPMLTEKPQVENGFHGLPRDPVQRSIHTGDVLGTPTHIVVSLSSLLLVAMVLTGVVIWWKKLAV